MTQLTDKPRRFDPDDSSFSILTPRATWKDLVLPPAETALLRQIGEVADRAKVQDGRVRKETKRAAAVARAPKSEVRGGIAALFAGESGTGKSLAAEVLARQLERNLFRVDLAAVVSKYIGETEKALRELFDRAESSGAILILDEADALFGKRTEVSDSRDRYANIDVTYILQRIQANHGLTILTTKRKDILDPEFLRQMRFIVDFPARGATDAGSPARSRE